VAYESTDVAVEKSQGEIRKLLFDHGAANFSFGEDVEPNGVFIAMVEFVHGGQRVRMRVPHKPVNPRVLAEKVRRAQTRTADQIKRDLAEQEARRIWRVLFHGLKARLVSVEEGVETFEEAFLAHLVDPASDRTLWEQAKGFIESGAMKLGGAGLSVGQPALPSASPTWTALATLEAAAGIQAATDLGPDATNALYKRALIKAHPDHGGTREQLEAVQAAGKLLGVA